VLLPSLVEALQRISPAITLRVRAFTARDEAVAMLDAGEVDLTVSVPATMTTGRILTRPLFEERFVCIVRRNHPAARAPLDLGAFLELSHLLVSPEGSGIGYVDAALAKQGLKRRLAITLPHMHAVPALIARTDMIATVMGGAVATSGHAHELCVLDPPLDLEPVQFVMSWHRRNDTHPAQRWFRDRIISLSDNPPLAQDETAADAGLQDPAA